MEQADVVSILYDALRGVQGAKNARGVKGTKE
jgi:hypothetical protein